MKFLRGIEDMQEHHDSRLQDFVAFLKETPTAWHVVETLRQRLKDQGFIELKESESWQLEKGKGYFVIRNGSLCSFVMPLQNPTEARILATHTDSPALKLKPHSEFLYENMLMLGVEVYGSPLLSSWLNRDLGIAGKIIYETPEGQIKEALVNLTKNAVTIPQLAIHLDRNVNDQGLILNKQTHLSALAAINPPESLKNHYLEVLVNENIECKTILSHDLFLVPLEPPRLSGYQQQMIFSYRIDNLSSVHSAYTAFTQDKSPHDSLLKMAVFFDNEEIGSSTSQGAGSPFLPQVMERIVLATEGNREDYFRLLSESLCISIDLAHALNPNYPEKHEPNHKPLLGKGIVLKSNAQGRYASDARASALISQLCKKANIDFQKFVARSDIPCGSTIGPITANLTGMNCVDIGCGQLSMHSCREVMACDDHLDMCTLLSKAF